MRPKTENHGRMARWSFHRDLLPALVIVGIECSDTGLFTLFKAATLKGMSDHVFVAYAYAVATIVLLPVPFFSRRSRVLPPLNFSILSKIALLGLIGSSSQIFGYAGISYSSPTLNSAVNNLVPAFTFLLAVIFRMENIALKSRSSQAKILGSIISISGAFIVTFYKGSPIIINHSPPSYPVHQQPIGNSILTSVDRNWVIGGLLLTADNLLVPLWYILQVEILKEYPDELTMVFFYNVTATIVATIVALFTETNASAWKIGLDMSLVSIVCSGIFGKFMSNAVYAWAVHLKGPVFVTMFKPLSIVIAVAMGVMFLGDTLHVGSIIGATIISIGLYCVMWGKATEEAEGDVGNLESPTIENAPLLQSYKTVNSEKKIDGNV